MRTLSTLHSFPVCGRITWDQTTITTHIYTNGLMLATTVLEKAVGAKAAATQE